ncbi:MAG: type IV pilus twitching motility protein PilT [Thermodesulfobacteriota bacterium]
MAEKEIDGLLRAAIRADATDIHLKAGSPPVFRIDGTVVFIKEAPSFTQEVLERMAFSLMNKWQREKYERTFEMDFAYDIEGLSRFRFNVFQQQGTISMAIRAVPFEILGFSELNLPPILEKISQEERGLIIATGTTSSGKSTTLAAIIDYINSTRPRHIITIEDPLEYVHRDKKSIIQQREVDIDTLSFTNALRSAMREDPNVILVGEMRDLETMEIAMAAAETGHLVLTTLHTLDAQETINRILSIFPPNQHNQIRYQLSQILKAIISQRLMPISTGKGRVPAVEVLIATARIRECISDPTKTAEIRTAIEEGSLHYGMQTFDQCLFDFYKKGMITYDEMMRQATNKDDLALKASGITSGADAMAEEIDRRGKERAKHESIRN